MSFQSVVQFPEKSSPELVELRSELGALYLHPSRWERLRLLWTFRHFHVLSSQVLSRGDQRLIDRLAQSALVTPPVPIPGNAILGVVEKPALRPRQVAPRPSATKVYPAQPMSLNIGAASQESRNLGEAPFPQWKALGVLMCVCFLVILARVYRDSIESNLSPAKKTAIITSPSGETAVGLRLAAAGPFRAETTRPRLTLLVAAPTVTARPALMVARTNPAPLEPAPKPDAVPVEPAPIASASPELLLLSDLPQGHLVKPVITDPNLVGTLRLRALIGPDGAVKDVTVLSGNPKLAEAGVLAVRHWHYTQYAAQGSQRDAEAVIGMSFFGPDAISISSLGRTNK
jgi:hypothetical protein